MGRTAVANEARARAHLLIRLAAIALGGTLVLLAAVGATSTAALVLVLYLAAAVAVRYLPVLQRVPLMAPGLDLIAITALVFALPLDLGTWVLYVFPVGVAALGTGPVGAIATTAIAVVGYDAALIVRLEQARATDLWPVQALIAIGLVVAEIVWALGRRDVDTLWSRLHARALSGLTRQREPDEVMRTLVPELARLQGVRGAWIWALTPDRRLRTTVTAGAAPPHDVIVGSDTMRALAAPVPLQRVVPEMNGIAIPLSPDPAFTVGVALEQLPDADRATTHGAIHDLVGDAASLLAAALERQRLLDLDRAHRELNRSIAEVDGERTQAGALASTILEAGRLADGRAAVVRLADGAVVVGDLPGAAIAELARDRRLPAIVSASVAPVATQTLGAEATVGIVPLSEGRVLAAIGPGPALTARLPLIERLAEAARDRLALLAERDALQASANELGRDVESLGGALRAKEDALATAVHELRNPLTAVHGYATLMSKNLQAVQGQLTQLERLMADLLSAERRTEGGDEGGEASVDAAAETREAIARARVRGAKIDLDAPETPIRLAIGQARFAQLMDNLISNAMKYSPPGAPILVDVDLENGDGRIRVVDQGIGIPQHDLARIFDRFYRAGAAGSVAGQGLGLSICKEIVLAHGGRIWAESEGTGRGSTFAFTLPLAVPAAAA